MGKLEITVLSDEEFYAMKDKEKREMILNNLLKVAEKRPSAPVSLERGVVGRNSPTQSSIPPRSQSNQEDNNGLIKRSNGMELPLLTAPKVEATLDDDTWNSILSKADEYMVKKASPIESITEDEIQSFSLLDSAERLGRAVNTTEPDVDKRYATMFKKETAMLAEVLKDVNEQTRIVSTKLKALTGKGSYAGVSKSLSELLEVSNSMANTKLSVVKTMADLKTKQEDFRLKAEKLNPKIEEDVDSIANDFYSKIIGGGKNYSDVATPKIPENYRDVYNDGTEVIPDRFNITQGYYDTDEGGVELSEASDPHGHIRNELNGSTVVVHRFSDNSVVFTAVDDNGFEVEGVELPDDEVLESLDIKHGSSYALDKYGRRYKIIDVDTDGVDLSDLDDDDEMPTYRDAREDY